MPKGTPSIPPREIHLCSPVSRLIPKSPREPVSETKNSPFLPTTIPNGCINLSPVLIIAGSPARASARKTAAWESVKTISSPAAKAGARLRAVAVKTINASILQTIVERLWLLTQRSIALLSSVVDILIFGCMQPLGVRLLILVSATDLGGQTLVDRSGNNGGI